MDIRIKYNLDKVRKTLALQFKDITTPIFEAWGTIYRASMQQRFNRYARGGGDWVPLKEGTIRGRRKARKSKTSKKPKKRKVSILIDTGTLWGTLNPQFVVPGQLQEIDENSITVGIDGGTHPGGLTIGALASYHHFGTEHIPAREILVEPDDKTKKTMAKAMEIGIAKGLD